MEDPFGNRLLEAYSTATSTPCASGAYDNTQQMNTPQSSASNNRLSTLTYDAAGNATIDSVSGNQYAYDGEGRLCAVYNNLSAAEGKSPFTQYIYDAGGTRVAKGSVQSLSCGAPGSNGFTLTNQYLLDLGSEQVTELNGNWVHSNAFEGGRLTGTYASDGKGVHFSIADPLGTKRVQLGISSSGTAGIDENCYSLPFGNTPQTDCQGPGVDATEHHFTGKERDTESGNDYFEARYYSSAMGRFMSPDWSAKEEPVPYAKLDDPQTLNLYSYVQNNPLTRIDADGHESDAEKQKKLPPPDANHDHTLTVRQVSGQNGNPMGHVTVQVDGGKEVGFAPVKDMTKTEIAMNKSVPGTVEPRAKSVKTLDAVTIHLTKDQAKNAQATIDARAANPGNFQTRGRSCVDFGESVVHSTGAKAPSDDLPGHLVQDIRSQQLADHSSQAP